MTSELQAAAERSASFKRHENLPGLLEAGSGLSGSPRKSGLGTSVILSPDDYHHLLTIRNAYLAELDSRNKAIPNAVMQTTPTNCFRACVATIFGCDIDLVPQGCDGATWDWDAFQDWLSMNGYQAIEIGFGNGGTIYPVRSPVPCILTGQSPRECKTGRHAVVARLLGLEGFELLHDPHQSGEMFEGDPTHAVFFVPMSNPRLRRKATAKNDFETAVMESRLNCPGGDGCQCCCSNCDCGCRDACPKFRSIIRKELGI